MKTLQTLVKIKHVFFLSLFSLLLVGTLNAQTNISFDDNGVGVATASQKTIAVNNYTVPAGNDRILLIFIAYGGNNQNVLYVRHGQTDATLIKSETVGSLTSQCYYVLLGSGSEVTNNITSARTTTAVPYHMAVGSFQNVDQANPIGAINGITGNSGSASLTIPTSGNSMAIDFYFHNNSLAPTPGAGQTELAHVNAGYDSKASYKAATGSSTTMSGTGRNGRSHAYIVFEMNEAITCVDPDVSISHSDLPDFCQGYGVLTADLNNAGDLEDPISYSWGGGETESSIAIFANGSYDVMVTEGGGCQGSAAESINVNLWDMLSGYVVLGDEVDLYGNTVSGGGVGVSGDGEKAKMRGGSVVSEFVKAPVIDVNGGSSVIHEELGQVTLALPAFKAASPNSDDITVSAGSAVTLTGSTYGEIEVKKGATLTIDAAEVDIEDLDIEDDGVVIFTQDTELKIEDDFKMGENAVFNVAGQFVVVYVGDRVTIEEGSDVHARMYAQDKIHVKKADAENHTTMNGMFISLDKVDGDDYVDWNWDLNCAAPLNGGSAIIIEEEGLVSEFEANYFSSAPIENPNVTLYSNPARDILNIQLDGMDAEAKVMIFDSMGRLVWERNMEKGQRELQANLSNNVFQNGLYVVSVISNDQKIAKRLLISK